MLAVNLLNYTVQNSFSVNTSNVVPPLLHRYLYSYYQNARNLLIKV